MKRYRYIWIYGFILFIGLHFISGCQKQVNLDDGILQGKISIGPICPVERIPPDPGCLPTAETYKAYPVSVWTSNGKRKIAQIDPALDGSFKIELKPGKYMVILEREYNRIGSSNLPVEVLIFSNNKTLLNIDIDTGIR